jgi:hypothetical protein
MNRGGPNSSASVSSRLKYMNPITFKLYYSELSTARARLYVEVEGLGRDVPEGLRLQGTVRGPRNALAKTLPTSYSLDHLGETVLAQAIVTDPCFWSPETPNIYDVSVKLVDDRKAVWKDAQLQVGFCPLSIQGRFFHWEGKPWILRGISAASVTEHLPITAWKGYGTAFLENPTDEVLQTASSQGVIVFADLSKRLILSSLYPAAAFVRLPVRESYCSPPNSLLSLDIHSTRDIAVLPDAHFVHAHIIDGVTQIRELAELKAPVVVHRPLPWRVSVEEARAACDKLQADLAPYGQFAGYVV